MVIRILQIYLQKSYVVESHSIQVAAFPYLYEGRWKNVPCGDQVIAGKDWIFGFLHDRSEGINHLGTVVPF